MNQLETLMLEAQIVEQLRTCFDPEIPVNIVLLSEMCMVQPREQVWGLVPYTQSTPQLGKLYL
jgi:metal-sulfur cluster biosynthetic enzyme